MFYRVPAYCNKGSFKEDAELCKCTGGKAVFFQSPGVLCRKTRLKCYSVTNQRQKHKQETF